MLIEFQTVEEEALKVVETTVGPIGVDLRVVECGLGNLEKTIGLLQ
jgi:hypothetical protein